MPDSTLNPATASPERSSARWLLVTLALIGAIVTLDLVIAWRMDVFGLLRDPTGRALITSHHERKAKYFLNERYVPANFDALIIGASASVNWRPQELTGYRFYDESLEGGNASEERFLVEHALERGHFKVALVGLAPHVTQYHAFVDGLDAANRAEALGSLDSLLIEQDVIVAHLRHRSTDFYPDGSHEMPSHTPAGPKPGDPRWNLQQDPRSVADYRALVEELQSRGTRVVYVVYPFYQPMLDYNREGLTAYRSALPQTLPSAPLIDFNAPAYLYFRSNPANFIDEVHLSRSGADTLTRIINIRMHELLHD